MSAQIAAGPLAWGALERPGARAYLQYGLGVLLIGIAGKLAYGEATGEKVATSLTLGSIVAVPSLAIGASLVEERRAPTLRPLNEVT